MQRFLDLFLVGRCPLCDRSTTKILCQYCLNQLQECQLPNPEALWKGDVPAFTWGNYEGILKRAIAALKYENQPQIGDILGEYLASAWLKAPLFQTQPKLVVVPIPLHAQKMKQRGYNQAAIIAKTFAQIVRLPYRERALIRKKDTKAQFGLSIAARADNVAKAFSLEPELSHYLQGRKILLVDDIYTTGATIKSAAQTCQASGITVWGVAAIATPEKKAKILIHDYNLEGKKTHARKDLRKMRFNI